MRFHRRSIVLLFVASLLSLTLVAWQFSGHNESNNLDSPDAQQNGIAPVDNRALNGLTELATHADHKTNTDEDISNLDWGHDQSSITVSTDDIDAAEWLSQRGWSPELADTYDSYDTEALLTLAADGDIYALAISSFRMRELGQDELAYSMLIDAAARGSSSALITAGGAVQSALRLYQRGHEDESELRRIYGIEWDDLPIQQALEIAAAANYVTAGIRGDVHMSELHLKELQNDIGRTFTSTEWQVIGDTAKNLYQGLAQIRNSLGMEPFDNSYPASDVVLFGFPRENNWFESGIWKERVTL